MPMLTLDQILDDLTAVTTEVETEFGSLADGPFNWKPTPGEWSVAQCLDHLTLTNRAYFPEFERVIRGEPSANPWTRAPLLPAFFGWMLKKALAPDSTMKTKTFKTIEPSTSQLPLSIITDFAAMQQQLAGLMRATASLDGAKIRITSPVINRVITYSLQDCRQILASHERLHLNQARRVMASPRFPG